ncbi:MAG: hypothetical protein HC899_23875 [Leptolyngbyaceae cyanobacterium SM1_4_3]|nr:hypothetical protein [Leptolyngbyaceae cyanobacterium SM1_4_3]
MKLKSTEEITLQAFLVGLAQLDAALPADLQHKIQQLGGELAQQKTGAIAKIPQLVNQHERLKELYQEARLDLQQRYQAQERAKNALLVNSAASAPATWEEIAVPILTADNSITAARSVIKQAIAHITSRRASSYRAASHVLIVQVAQKIEAQEIAVLQALERRPLTVEDLTYVIGAPLEQVQAIVQSLWQTGYIDVITSSLLHRILPRLKPPSAKQQEIYPETAFTLTMKGHFRLHPLVSGRLAKGAT